jgi:hypothetical protein
MICANKKEFYALSNRTTSREIFSSASAFPGLILPHEEAKSLRRRRGGH